MAGAAGMTPRRDRRPDLSRERELARPGCLRVAGVDEAGRGAWAGPVAAGAVILPLDDKALARALAAVRDSKLLTPRQREALEPLIQERALAWGVGLASHAEIDGLGILPATRLAMQRALEALALPPEALIIDAVKLPAVPMPQRVMFHADTLCLSVAAASILAKVARDRLMTGLEAAYPGYAFARHKGYGTAAHREALARLGPSAIHRLSFQPIKTLVESIQNASSPCP